MTAVPAADRGSIVDRVMRLWRDHRVRLSLTVLAVAYLMVRAYLLLTSDDPLLAADAYTYWSAPDDDPYRGPQLGLPGAYLYPPPFIQVMAPLRILPWEAFHVAWLALGLGSLIFLVGPIGGALALTALPFVYRDLLVGNIHLMLGAAIVIGLRYPPAWAFPLLTKLTPGIGLAYFLGQGRWRKALLGIGVTVAVAVVSYALAPDLWPAWVGRMRGDSSTAGSPYLAILAARSLLSLGLVIYAARSDRPWLVPIGVVVALPVLWPDSLAILLACFPLLPDSARRRSPST